jgi:ligand-binding SRPBCC domain-containing protein
LITTYNPPYEFVDEQLRGPYAFWFHRHLFKPVPGGTEMTDSVHYALPFGVLGTLAHLLFVKRQVRGIFEYRGKVLGGALAKAIPGKIA